MKKIRLLGILAIIAIIASFIGNFNENWNDFRRGFEDGSGMNQKERNLPEHAKQVDLLVRALPGTAVDSLNNSTIGRQMSYEVTEIQTYVKEPVWHVAVILPGIFVVLAFLYGFYCLIRLLISISRREVFTATNVWRIRWFSYSLAGVSILIFLMEWLSGTAAMKQVSIPGYEVIGYAGDNHGWLSIIIMILFAEIFAIGVKIKEEQDLTI